METKVIGTITTYVGTEHPYLTGCKVRIVAVLRGAADLDADPGQVEVVRDDGDLAGGVTADDRVEVQPWLEAQGRFSFVTSDALAVDLDCFRQLVGKEHSP